jgi:hypothetical protein
VFLGACRPEPARKPSPVHDIVRPG